MKLPFAAILITLLFICNSCKKKDKAPEEETPAPKAYYQKTSRDSSNGSVSSTEYLYNSDGTLKRSTQNTGEFTTYDWATNQIVVKYFSASNLETLKLTYILNGSGQVTSVNASFSGNSINILYEYDANGYMSKSTGDGTTTTYTVTNGNVSRMVVASSGPPSTTVYEYYTDKANTIGNASIGLNVAGKESKNLVKTETLDDGVTTGNVTHFDYEFDSKNRVIKKTRTSNDVAARVVTTYTYYE